MSVVDRVRAKVGVVSAVRGVCCWVACGLAGGVGEAGMVGLSGHGVGWCVKGGRVRSYMGEGTVDRVVWKGRTCEGSRAGYGVGSCKGGVAGLWNGCGVGWCSVGVGAEGHGEVGDMVGVVQG